MDVWMDAYNLDFKIFHTTKNFKSVKINELLNMILSKSDFTGLSKRNDSMNIF